MVDQISADSNYESIGRFYEGEKDAHGAPHGKGRIYFHVGTSYVGNFEHGAFFGEGTLHLGDGDYLKGNWVNQISSKIRVL